MMENRKTNICCYLLFGLLFIIMLTVYGYGVYFLKNHAEKFDKIVLDYVRKPRAGVVKGSNLTIGK